MCRLCSAYSNTYENVIFIIIMASIDGVLTAYRFYDLAAFTFGEETVINSFFVQFFCEINDVDTIAPY